MAFEGLNIFVSTISRRLAREASRYAAPKIPSTTLRRAQRVEPRGGRRGRLVATSRNASHIPHYWAEFLNDGHDRILPRRAKRLLWFKDPARDPRFPGRVTPQRLRQVKRLRLSEQQFKRLKQSGQIVIARFSSATERVGFYDNDRGMQGFDARANQVANNEVQRYITDGLRRENILRIQQTITVRI